MRPILGFLVVVVVAVVTYAGLSAFNGVVHRQQLETWEAAKQRVVAYEAGVAKLGAELLRSGAQIVQAAEADGNWQLRCLHLGDNCSSDPQGLVDFSAIFALDGVRLFPPEDRLARTVIEDQEWERAKDAVLASLRAARAGADRLSARLQIVSGFNGWAGCAAVSPASEEVEDGRIHCAVLDRGAVERRLVAVLSRVQSQTASPIVLVVRAEDTSKTIGAAIPPGRHKVLLNSTLSAPFGLYRVEAIDTAKSGLDILPMAGLLAVLVPGLVAVFWLAGSVQRAHAQSLEAAELRAEQASKLSHDLRTPLTNIRLYAGMLDDSQSALERRESIATIIREVDWLDGLIEQTLCLVRDGEGGARERLCPDDVVGQICERFAPLLATRGITIERDFQASRQVRVDRWALEQVLINLLDNVRHHAPSSLVRVHTKLDAHWLGVEVANSLAGGGAAGEVEAPVRGVIVDTGLPVGSGVDVPTQNGEVAGGGRTGPGHGFGLEICRSVLRSRGGRLGLDADGKVFRVRIQLPAS